MGVTDRRPEPDLIDDLLHRCTFPTVQRGQGAPHRAGVSGGADSLALLVLARRAGMPVIAVHVDHGLRPGSAAEADAVADVADRLGAGFESVSVDVAPGPDLEQRARIARHRALGPDAMVGHTADDQAETVLINLLRGAGPDGLAAIAPGPRHPILALRRADTEAVCTATGLSWLDDPSNGDDRFVRNRVRHEVLPLLADIAGRDPVPLLARTATANRAAVDFVDELAVDLDPTDTRALAAVPDFLARRALRRWLAADHPLGHPPSWAELERVLDVVHHRAVACELIGFRRVARTDGRLRIEATGR